MLPDGEVRELNTREYSTFDINHKHMHDMASKNADLN